MKNLLLITLIVLIVTSCSDDDNVHNSVVGTYQLTAIFADPGDGSVEFDPVESERKISLYSDSTFLANFSFCNGLSTEAIGNSKGTFSSSELTFEEDCNNSIPSNKLLIDFTESELIISYSCFEGCSEKYTKIPQ